jgi:CheY-like chemotaxis protein
MLRRGIESGNWKPGSGSLEVGQCDLANTKTTMWMQIVQNTWQGAPRGTVPNIMVRNSPSVPGPCRRDAVPRTGRPSMPVETVRNGRAEAGLMSRSHAAVSAARLMIVSDLPPSRPEDLTQALSHAHGFSICAAAAPWGQALKTIGRLHPHLVLLEAARLGRNHLQLIRTLRSSHPGVKLLFMGGATASQAASALRAGADGCVSKGEDPEEVAQAIHDVLDGLIYVSEEMVCAASCR